MSALKRIGGSIISVVTLLDISGWPGAAHAAAERIARELECRVLSINHMGSPGAEAPFGGVKDSGIGREGGAESLDAYLVTKTVLQSTVWI